MFQVCVRNNKPLKAADYEAISAAATSYQVIKDVIPIIRMLSMCGFVGASCS